MILLGFIVACVASYMLVNKAFDARDRRKARRQSDQELRDEPW